MLDFKIPDDEFPRIGIKPPSRSRRVILRNLPRECTLTQILDSIQDYPYIQLGIYDTSRIPYSGAQCAMIEFLTSDSAGQFYHLIQSGHVQYKDAHDRSYNPHAYLPESHAPDLRGANLVRLRFRWTQTVKAEQFPREAVWFFLCVYGLKNIVKATYDERRSTLRVTFKSICLAGVTLYSIREGQFPYFQPRVNTALPNSIWERDYAIALHGGQSVGFDFTCVGAESSFAPDFMSNVFHCVSPNFLEEEFNQPPYNTIWPNKIIPIMRAHDAHLQLTPEQARERREQTQASQIEAEVVLSRYHWSWQTTRPDRTPTTQAAFLDETLSDPEWKTAWSRFFSANRADTINLQSWESYAALARHRRDQSAEQELPKGFVPLCDGQCGFGCCELKVAPLPTKVSRFVEWD